jgi:hypothetical protein
MAVYPVLDFRHGWWVLPWFAGLALLSYLGGYPSDESADNLNTVPYAWLVLAVFSAGIMWLAVASRLPRDRARAGLNHETAEEDIVLDREVTEHGQVLRT